jgi:hypothetical protein
MVASGKPVRIVLTTAEGALVLEALAELPFKTVFELIGELNRQATDGAAGDAHAFILDRSSLVLIVKALGELPYSRVHALLANLNAQIAQQG